MAFTRAEISKRWRDRNPEKVKAKHRESWLKHKELHPEIGTRDKPRNDTRFKLGQPKKPGAGIDFKVGHTINKGRPCWRKGKPLDQETKDKISKTLTGVPLSLERRQTMSLVSRANREKNHFWKGGITEQNKRERNRFEYTLWRESVFARDDYTCQCCGARGVHLHADHIKPFAYFPELRLDLDNGRSLCVPCHKLTDSFLWKAKVNYARIPS